MNCIHKDPVGGWCKLHSDWSSPMPVIEYCVEGPCPDEKLPSNADRFRRMTDEEIANERVYADTIRDMSMSVTVYVAKDTTPMWFMTREEAVASELDWLQQPAKEEP